MINIGNEIEYVNEYGESTVGTIRSVSSDMDSYDEMELKDGIPYYAYKQFSGASHVLVEAAREMLKPDGHRPASDFNAAFLCCLPKKAVRDDPALGALYNAKHTRPLSVVNTDNRLLQRIV